MGRAGAAKALRSERHPLFGLLDAGRDPEVLTLLYSHDARCRSLYQGESEATLGSAGPYLVELAMPAAEELLTSLVRKGWGQSWGVYLSTPASFDEVRHHFRTLLMV